MPTQNDIVVPASSNQYSSFTGLIYIFNLIVGTGCLTLPAAFAQTGWILSTVGICLLALLSFITATWVLESMACANAVTHWRLVRQLKIRGQVDDDLVNKTLENAEADRTGSLELSSEQEDHEEDLLISEGTIERTVGDYYAIVDRIEMGQMAKMFFSKGCVKVFYVVLCVYLYGDLAIYEAAVAKSLRDITCSYVGEDCHVRPKDTAPCFSWASVTRLDVYRIYTGVFLCCMGPFVFLNLSKTKYMQIATSITRWIAMGSMITWAILLLANGRQEGHPPPGRLAKLPEFFGVCVYAFMCHHSLPSLVTPISDKKALFKLLAVDYLLILVFYNLLALTGVFAFGHLNDLYTLNFQPDPCVTNRVVTPVYCLQVFLLLFPVFTLSTNFPIIAITLRNNLKGLFLRETRRYSYFVSHCLFPLLAILPPTAVGLITSNIEFLVGITGAYAGSIIQYVVPAALVYYARKNTIQRIGMGVRNPFKSPFQHGVFLVFICSWAVVCQVLVSVYLFRDDGDGDQGG